MKRDILLESSHGISRLAVAEQGRIVEIFWEEDSCPGILQNIYVGRVVQRIPGMNAAFVDLGLSRNAFLDLQETDRKIQVGETVLVQVVREGEGEKGPLVSQKIHLAGYTAVYSPFESGIHSSGKLTKQKREEMSEFLSRQELPGGWILRTACAQEDPEAVLRECRALCERWESVKKQAGNGPVPRLLREEGALWHRAVRDYALGKEDRVLVDGDRLFETIRSELSENGSPLCAKLTGNPVQGLLFDAFRAEEAMKEAMGRMVRLPCGGTIVLDETEAMTVIDVNSGKYTGGNGFLKVNLEAAKEVARQIRLRDLGGIVIVDFIDMNEDGEREQVRNVLREAVRTDRVPVTVYGFTELGLIEMVRKRGRRRLSSYLHGKGPGREESRFPMAFSVWDALRAVDRVRLSGEPGKLCLLVPGKTADAIREKSEDPMLTVIRDDTVQRYRICHPPGETTIGEC